MVSILDILSGAVPLMVDVRQTGGSPGHEHGGMALGCVAGSRDEPGRRQMGGLEGAQHGGLPNEFGESGRSILVQPTLQDHLVGDTLGVNNGQLVD
jgi:hypothetical protein